MTLSRRQFLGWAGALALSGCAHRTGGSPGQPGRLTFAAVNDLHVLDAASTNIVHRAVRGINANPDVAFTVILGDIATDGKLPELNLAWNALANLTQPWVAVPGNHDVYPGAEDIYANYRKTFHDTHWLERNDGWLFLGIDSCEGAASDVSVSGEQTDWIARRLRRIPTATPIALFAHHPFNPHTKKYRVLNADAVLGLFAHHNLRLVAAGHYHGNQVERQGNILYTTTACCSSTRGNFDGTDAKGYRLFHLDGQNVETEFVEVPA